MKFVYALAVTACFIVLLFTFYLIHVWYIPVNVVFYSTLIDAVLAAAVMAAALFFLGQRWLPFNGFENILLITIWLLGGYAFAISIPTVLDRSLSFYILEKLQQRGGGIQKSRLVEVIVQEFIPESRLLDVRITEQLESGTITIDNNCVKLTARGWRLANFSRFFRKNLLPKQRLLAGQYTDALVDPFSNSPKGKMGYECDR